MQYDTKPFRNPRHDHTGAQLKFGGIFGEALPNALRGLIFAIARVQPAYVDNFHRDMGLSRVGFESENDMQVVLDALLNWGIWMSPIGFFMGNTNAAKKYIEEEVLKNWGIWMSPIGFFMGNTNAAKKYIEEEVLKKPNPTATLRYPSRMLTVQPWRD